MGICEIDLEGLTEQAEKGLAAGKGGTPGRRVPPMAKHFSKFVIQRRLYGIQIGLKADVVGFIGQNSWDWKLAKKHLSRRGRDLVWYTPMLSVETEGK